MKTQDLPLYVAGAAALGLAWWIWSKGGIANAAASAAGAVADAAGQVATGTVLGIGDAVGVPRTSQTECEKAIAEGRTWDASFACPAGQFLGSVWDRATGGGPPDPNQSAAESSRLAQYERGGVASSSGAIGMDEPYADPMGGFYPY